MEVLLDTYKDTKIGRIPQDWELKMLVDIASFRRGSFPQPYGLAKWYDDENGHPFIQVYDVGKQMKLKPNTKRKISDAAAEKSVFVVKGTLILTIQGSIGRVAITQYDAYIDRTLLIFQSFLLPTDKIFLSSQLEVLFNKERQKANGSTILTITKAQLSKFLIPFPPLPEQQKIAAILSTLDEQISITDKIIEKSKELKKGLMQRFFLNKAYMIMSLGEAEKTELMPIKFKALGKILTGTTPPTANKEYYDSEDYMFIGPADLGKVKDVKSSKKYISVKGFDVTRKLPENALMVVCIGATIGKIGLTSKPCATNQQVNTIVPKEEYSARYLYYVIGGLKKYLLGFAGDTATPQLNKTDFGKVVTFIHKSKSERTKIAAILSEADAKIEKEQEQKAQLEQLKKGLMQQLLTGKKRVKV